MQVIESVGGYISDIFGTAQSNVTTDVLSESETIAEADNADGFTAMLSLLSLNSGDTEAQSEDVMTDIQSAFMTSLGVTDGAAEAMNLLASDEGLAKLQGTFLSVLKADLMKSAASQTGESDTVEAVDTAATTASENESSPDWATFMDKAFGEDGVDWNDGFDAVNMLHHIPLVSDFYQNVSSSHISAASDLAGSLLYGGPAGLAYSAVNLGVKEMTGDSITNHLWSAGHDWLFSEETTGTDESVAEGVVGEQGEAVAQSAYEFARRKFDAD